MTDPQAELGAMYDKFRATGTPDYRRFIKEAERRGAERAVEYVKDNANAVDIEAGFDLKTWESLLEAAKKVTD